MHELFDPAKRCGSRTSCLALSKPTSTTGNKVACETRLQASVVEGTQLLPQADTSSAVL